MTAQKLVHLTTTSLAPIILIALLYFLYEAELTHNVRFYQFAFYALVTVVLLMETRVRIGYKTKRGKLFYFHLAFAIPFLVSLAVLAFFAQPLWLIILADMLLGLLGIAGIVLLYRNMRFVPHRLKM